ncbi:cellulose binding domain-containing protein [Microbispora sp. RL4-1S]|uniref:Cellulose binding domain-containing protein n=1 Tax=Microbispora oryzae TaxID=2806554 RepID=A0A940WLJ1_9ACTN|nr:cellulose binding domain-containing protein [Microbispora oryzae]MBP2707701.1 cellulose binding domain-containing protein [Microbispora oryzae]
MTARRPLVWAAVAGAALAAVLMGPAVSPALGQGTAATPAPTPAAPATPTRAATPSAPASTAGTSGADTSAPTKPPFVNICPPPVPAGSITAYVGLCWAASTDDVGVTGYEVYRLDDGGFVLAASPAGTSTVMSNGLVYGHDYTYYIVAKDAAGNVSEPSVLVTTTAVTGARPTATPSPTGDTTSPTAPTGLRPDCVYDIPGTSFCWDASTDNVGVTGYDIYRQTATGYIKVGSRSASSTWFYETGLVTGRSYTYFVVARDAAGNISRPSGLVTALARQGFPTYSPSPTPTSSPSPSPSVSPSPSASPASACAVTYSATSWNTGFTATVTITNIGGAAIDGWTLRFAFPAPGQKVTSGWSATWLQSGADVSATALSWNARIAPGASVQIGFNGSHTGVNPAPGAFTLNGARCAAV